MSSSREGPEPEGTSVLSRVCCAGDKTYTTDVVGEHPQGDDA